MSDSAENFPNLTFSQTFLDFHPSKFLTPFFSHSPQFRISPYFPVSIHFPYFRNFFFSPYFYRIPPPPLFQNYTFFFIFFVFFFPPSFYNIPPPRFRKSDVFLHILRVFRFPTTFTMMPLCITQCTYWTPLNRWITEIDLSAAADTMKSANRSSLDSPGYRPMKLNHNHN